MTVGPAPFVGMDHLFLERKLKGSGGWPRSLYRDCRHSPWVPTTSVDPRIDRGPRVRVLDRFTSQGGQLVTPTPPPRLPASSVGTGDLCGAINWRPRPLYRGHRYPRRTLATLVEGRGLRLAVSGRESIGNSDSESSVDSGVGSPINDPDPSTEVADPHGGSRQPRWRGRGRRLAASTSPSLSIFFLELK
ncbi:hypothetical protein CRG98_013049 [Punica granatum]|uniref:Uncharacterized protein n=1 Tax=Punica granatum TaxID=22663 RepID=A0A2I0KDG7_PUNGR|nr:hypothetical protein CRG98_013049 [Punica granatum]